MARARPSALGTLDDACQAGRLGAIEAARKFDPARGVKFASFAQRRIAGEIMDAARAASLVKIPRLAMQRNEPLFFCSTVGTFRPVLGDEATPRAMWLAEIEPVAAEKGGDDATEALGEFWRTLTKKEKLIVGLYFGLDGQAPLTMRQVAATLGLSESRVSQMVTHVLERARQFGPLVETQRKISHE